MSKRIFVVTLLLFFLTGCQFAAKEDGISSLGINGKSFRAEVADDPQEREKGLSGREELAKDKGMLFVFEKKKRPDFCMRGMLFPLDFIWIKENKVVDLHKNIRPGEVQPPDTITPSKEVNKVLEVNGGVIEEYDINIGDKVEYSGNN